MSGRKTYGVVALVCAAAVSACDCEGTKLKQRSVIDDMSVQAHGGVSCGGEPVRLRALVFGGQPPFTYEWSPAAGVDDPASASPMVEADATREYTVRVWDRQGLEKTATATVGRGGPPVPSLEFKKGSALTCAGERVVLDASKSVDRSGLPVRYYSWQRGDAPPVVGPDASTPPFVPEDGEEVVLTVTDASGCSASLRQTLQVRARPAVEVAFTQGDQLVCDGSSVALTAVAIDADGAVPATVGWDLDEHLATLEVEGLATGSFQPTASKVRFRAVDTLGCDTMVSTTIDLRPLPVPAIRFQQGSAQVCEGTMVTLDGSASVGGGGGEIAAFSWDLDGNPGTVESTSATPPPLVASGARQVRLTVTDAAGCTASVEQPLTARPLPVADIAFVEGRADVCQGDGVRLSAERSLDADGQPVASTHWDFDRDGAVDSTELSPPRWVPAASQLVQLTVTDAFGCSSTASAPVSPRALPTAKVAFVAGQADMCAGDEVALDASGSRDADGNEVALFEWDLDGVAATTESNAPVTGSFSPSTSVRLAVTDARGCSSSLVQPLTVRQRPTARIAFASGGAAVCEGDEVTLDASGSSAPAGASLVAYRWDLDGDGRVDAQGRTPNAISAVGTRAVKLTVEASNGCTSDASVSVSARPLPTAKVAFAQGRADACLGDAVALTAQGSVDADGAPITRFAWEGESLQGITSIETPAFVPTTSAPVRVRVTDAMGCSAEAASLLSPRALPVPSVNFVEGASAVCEGEAARLDARATRDADGQPVASFAWDLDGDASTVESGEALSPSFVPDGAPVRLTVVDRKGCVGELVQPVSVGRRPVPRLSFVAGAEAVCASDEVRLDASASTTVDGNAVARFEWDTDGDSTTVESTFSLSPTLRPQASTTVRLTVYDAAGCGASTAQTIVAHPLPTARIGFDAGRANLCAGDEVALTAQASTAAAGASLASYAWDLDGDPSTIESNSLAPRSFVPSSAMTARLTVTDSNGCRAQASQPVSVRALPVASIGFIEGHANACQGEAVRLSGVSSVDADGMAVTGWAWDLDGDGHDDSLLSLTPELRPDRPTNVRLRVVDAVGCASETVTALKPRALPTPSIAFAQGSPQVCAGDGVRLSAAGSVDADGAPVTDYAWLIEGRTGAGALTGTFTPSGTPVVLTVSDRLGCSATMTQAFDVAPLPTARITFTEGDSLVCAGSRIALDGSSSRNASGQPVTAYEWDLNADGVVDATSVSAPAFTAAGNRTARLSVVDARGCRASAQQAVSTRAAPTARIQFAQGRADACQGDAVRLDGRSSVDADGQPVASYAWDLDGDGAFESSGGSPSARPLTNAVVARLQVTDGLGCQSTVAQTLAPRALPTAVIGFAQGGPLVCDGAPVQFTAEWSRDADGAVPRYVEWDLANDGVWDATGELSPAFTARRDEGVALRVRDDHGCTSSAVSGLSVRGLPVPKADFVEGSASVCSGDTVRLSAATSTDADGLPVNQWRWDVDGDGAFDASGVTSPALFPLASTTAMLEVTDIAGCSARLSRPLAVRPSPIPAIRFVEGDALSCEGESVRLSADGSRDASGALPVSFAWDLDGDGLTDASGVSPSRFTPLRAASPSLTVTDAQGCRATTALPLSVRAAPVVRLAFDVGGLSTCENGEVRVSGAASTDADGQMPTLGWDLDANGTVDATGIRSPLFAPRAGVPLQITATDTQGCTAQSSMSFSVRPAPSPVMTPSVPLVCAGETMSYLGTDSSDADGNPVAAWQWTLASTTGTVNSTSPVTASFAPTSAASSLVVTDVLGCSAGLSAAAPVGSPRQVLSTGTSTGGDTPPLDIVFVIDNSGSMTEEIEAVQRNINRDFADIIAASGLDWRIILVSRHGRAAYSQSICISSPLSGTSCSPVPSVPALTSRFFHYDVEVGSHNSFDILVNTAKTVDRNGFAPNGWTQWLRPDAHVAFVAITDDESTTPWETFVSNLSARDSRFGSAQAPAFTWYSIVGLKENQPSTEPWGPSAPVQTSRCWGQMEASGQEYQELSIRTGGLRFPLCLLDDFDVLFRRLAESVVAEVVPPCALTLPPGHGAAESSLQLVYATGGGATVTLERVPGPGQCRANAYWRDGDELSLCPQACDVVKEDPGASLTVTGCHPI